MFISSNAKSIPRYSAQLNSYIFVNIYHGIKPMEKTKEEQIKLKLLLITYCNVHEIDN